MQYDPVQHLVQAGDQTLCVFEWPGDGAPLLFAHATGFHARIWDRLIAQLHGRHAYAVDLRGHGRSSKPAAPAGYRWQFVGDDLAALVALLDLRDVIGIGHSWGAFGMVLAAADQPSRFARLILLDPVIVAESLYGSPFEGEHFAARRRADFESPDAMWMRFKDRPPFNTWDADVLRDYCAFGLLPKPDGDGMTLACSPHVEASIYAQFTSTSPYPAIRQIQAPVHVVRFGDHAALSVEDFDGSPTPPNLAAQFIHGHDIQIPHLTHFAPMQNPFLIAETIQTIITIPH
ncbi:MAG: alpha/beta hydrolase [bacterium]|nr:alpha/beta hydrolase [bacterium]